MHLGNDLIIVAVAFNSSLRSGKKQKKNPHCPPQYYLEP
jgi:hypothetical protein